MHVVPLTHGPWPPQAESTMSEALNAVFLKQYMDTDNTKEVNLILDVKIDPFIPWSLDLFELL